MGLTVLGVLVVLPSISNHLILDDHLRVLSRLPKSPIPEIPHAPFDLFTFGRPGALNEHFIDRGILLPWWTDPDYLVAFFRQLSALTHDLDGVLWPRSPALAHIQTIVWYAFLLFVVASVYRRMIEPPWVASLALLFYVLDDTHGDVVAWIAARHTIVSSALGLLAFLAHVRHRSPNRGWVGPVCFAGGLLAGEGAVAALAFLGSYAIFVDTGSRRSRALSLAPYAVVLVAWRIFYEWRGYGAFASDAYVDASREPIAFLSRFPAAMVLLLPVRARGVAWLGDLNDLVGQAVPATEDVEGQTIIIANPPTIDFASYLIMIRATQGERIPHRVRWFSTGKTGLALTRTSDRSLLVRPSAGFIADFGDRTFRAARRPIKSGETVALGDVTITVTEVGANGNPTAAEFAFREPLESRDYVWRQWTERRCESLRLPGVGETVTLPAIDLLRLLEHK